MGTISDGYIRGKRLYGGVVELTFKIQGTRDIEVGTTFDISRCERFGKRGEETAFAELELCSKTTGQTLVVQGGSVIVEHETTLADLLLSLQPGEDWFSVKANDDGEITIRQGPVFR